MKSRMTLILGTVVTLLVVYCSPAVFAQQTSAIQQQNQQLGAPTLKPQLSVGDVVFVLNILNQVNISGSEVEPFLEVKNVFATVLNQAQKDKKKEDDMVTVETTYAIANAFLQLYQRATVPGSAAERFQNVKNAFMQADKANQGKQQR